MVWGLFVVRVDSFEDLIVLDFDVDYVAFFYLEVVVFISVGLFGLIFILSGVLVVEAVGAVEVGSVGSEDVLIEGLKPHHILLFETDEPLNQKSALRLGDFVHLITIDYFHFHVFGV